MAKNTVLICDDNEAVHVGLGSYLKAEGIDVISAYDGETALEELRSKNIGVIVLDITDAYPPVYVMTSCYDFLREQAKPFAELLRSRGVDCEYHLYGEEGQKYMGHVFHCNLNLPEARVCNAAECEFFRRRIAAESNGGQ